jgi:hypothetical protein
LVALGFLIYSLLNLKSLGIKITYPRVLVEAFLFVTIFIEIHRYTKVAGKRNQSKIKTDNF